MANLVAVANGNLTAAATWATVDSTALLSNSTSSTTVGTTDGVSAAFTPGAISIDAIYLKLNYVAATPVASNTLTVTLYNNTDAVNVVSLAYNTVELPAIGTVGASGWICFKLDTTYNLIAGKAYTIKLKMSSSSSQPTVSFCTNGTAYNWQHMLRIPGTTAAPVAGDVMFISGELAAPSTWTTRTVTMDSTAATAYGTNINSNAYMCGGMDISKNGVLTWGTAESTNYILQLSGHLALNPDGKMYMGTVGTPCPRTSTMTLQFNNALSKNYSLLCYPRSTLVTQGQSRTSGKNIWRSRLSSTAAAGSTTINLVEDTGWKNGDIIVLTATEALASLDVAAINADAGASSITFASGTSYAHTESATKIAYAVNQTRNVVIKSLNTSYTGQVLIYHEADCDWTEFNYMVFYPQYAGEKSLDYCTIYGIGWSTTGLIYTPNGGVTDNLRIRNTMCRAVSGSVPMIAIDYEGYSDHTFEHIMLIGTNQSGNCFTYNGKWGADTVIDDIFACGINAYVFMFDFGTTGANWVEGTSIGPTNLYAIQCAYPFYVTNTYYVVTGATFSSWTATECSGTPLRIGGGNSGGFADCTFKDFTFHNCGSTVNSPVSFRCPFLNCTFENWRIATNATKAGTHAFDIEASSSSQYTVFDVLFVGGYLNSNTSGFANFSSGIFNALAANYNSFFKIRFRGVQLTGPSTTFIGGSTTYLSSATYWSKDGTADDIHEKTYIKRGTLSYETTTYRTTAPSMKFAPISATLKLFSDVRHVPVVDGATAKTIGCYMRKNSGYNGNAPRIMLKRNDQLGVTSETVIATATLTNADTWYSVSGALPVATDDGIYEVYVDCDGTAGNIFVDDWSIT